MERDVAVKIALAADHAGFKVKEILAQYLREQDVEFVDLGTDTADRPTDYPDYAEKVGEALRAGEASRGIVVCGSGVGVTVALNKIPGIRAASCHDTYSAHQGVEHDDMNVLCLGGRIVGPELAKEIAGAFLRAEFTAEERHIRRLDKIKAIEKRYLRDGDA